MCMNPTLRDSTTNAIELLVIKMTTERAANGVTPKYRSIAKDIRAAKDVLYSIPHKFTGLDGAHTDNNGNLLPYQVLVVSDDVTSLTAIRVDLNTDGTVNTYKVDATPTIFTLRSSGDWVETGSSLKYAHKVLRPGLEEYHVD